MSHHGRSWHDNNLHQRSTSKPHRSVDDRDNGYAGQQHERRTSPARGKGEKRQHERSSGDVGASSSSIGTSSKRTRFEEDGSNVREEGELTSDVQENSPEVEWEMQTEDDEARLIEERRRRRLAILQRHKSDVSTSANSASPSRASTPSVRDANDAPGMDAFSPASGVELASQDDLSAINLGNARHVPHPVATEMSAAEYDPAVDAELNREREAKLLVNGKAGNTASSLDPKPAGDDSESEYEDVEVSDDEDELDDMFAIDDAAESNKPKKIVRVKKSKKSPAVTQRKDDVSDFTASATLNDNWDDADGYYRITLGERIGEGGRYHVFANLGKGMFSAVVRARDTLQNDREVAIKIIRSQESMYKAGVKEMAVLQRLATLDPDDKRHLIRLLGHFEHRKHLCMVFESLSMNLREVIKRFGKDVGLNLRAVRAYAHQMLLALALMRKADIMHADLKPDNILVNEAKTALKVCDLGSASDLTEMEITPYLVSRFYRAPEIILGLPYDCALDVWSIGCTLYELFTGRILFPGKSNNHMLLLMQEVKGKFTTKQIRKGRFSGMHFDDQNAFVSRERDKTTGADVLRKVTTFSPSTTKTDLRSRILPPHAEKGQSPSDVRLTNSFIDLLGRMLELDPARRITPNQALHHPFFS